MVKAGLAATVLVLLVSLARADPSFNTVNPQYIPSNTSLLETVYIFVTGVELNSTVRHDARLTPTILGSPTVLPELYAIEPSGASAIYRWPHPTGELRHRGSFVFSLRLRGVLVKDNTTTSPHVHVVNTSIPLRIEMMDDAPAMSHVHFVAKMVAITALSAPQIFLLSFSQNVDFLLTDSFNETSSAASVALFRLAARNGGLVNQFPRIDKAWVGREPLNITGRYQPPPEKPETVVVVPEDDEDSGVDWGMIIGVAVGVALGVVILVWCLVKYHRKLPKMWQRGFCPQTDAKHAPPRDDVEEEQLPAPSPDPAMAMPAEDRTAMFSRLGKEFEMQHAEAVQTYAKEDSEQSADDKKRGIVRRDTAHGNALLQKGRSAAACMKRDLELPQRLRKVKVIARRQGCAVFKAMDPEGTLFSLKEVATKQPVTPMQVADLQKEISLLMTLKHPYIICYHGLAYVPPQGGSPALVIIVTDFVLGGSVKELLLETRGPLRESLARRIMCQVLMALIYLHSHGVAHRDIKPSNILIDGKRTVSLTDFGGLQRLAVTGTKFVTDDCVDTPAYMAPEVLHLRVGRRSDIWSVGATLLHMVTDKAPWSETLQTDPIALLEHITTSGAVPTWQRKSLSGPLNALLDLCFRVNYDERPAASLLAEHPWFALGETPGAGPTMLNATGAPRTVSAARPADLEYGLWSDQVVGSPFPASNGMWSDTADPLQAGQGQSRAPPDGLPIGNGQSQGQDQGQGQASVSQQTPSVTAVRRQAPAPLSASSAFLVPDPAEGGAYPAFRPVPVDIHPVTSPTVTSPVPVTTPVLPPITDKDFLMELRSPPNADSVRAAVLLGDGTDTVNVSPSRVI